MQKNNNILTHRKTTAQHQNWKWSNFQESIPGQSQYKNSSNKQNEKMNSSNSSRINGSGINTTTHKPEKRTQNAFKSKIAENISNNRFQWFFMHKFNGNVQCLTYSISVLPLYLAHSESSVYAQCMHYITLDMNNAVCIMPQLLTKNSLPLPFTPSPSHSIACIWFNFASPYNYFCYYFFFVWSFYSWI